jgi:HPt (histidine-containing phosphotransfer) domain-containing protein
MAKLQEKPVAPPRDIPVLPALDVDFLNTATFNDLPLRAEIISLFRQQIKTLTAQLAVPVDLKSWAYLTHTLKGSASAVGALCLADLADQWEQAAFPDGADVRMAKADQLSAALAAFDAVAATLPQS